MADEITGQKNGHGASGEEGAGPADPQVGGASVDGGGPVPEQTWARICPKCSVQSSTPGNYCPNCGASYKRKRSRLSKKAWAIIVAIVLVLGAATAVTRAVQHSQEVAAQEESDRKASEAEKKAVKEQKRLQEEAAAEADAERVVRAMIVDGLEESVQKDATERVDEGRLDGPIQRTECTPLGGGSVDDLTAITGTFECIAVNEKQEDGSESGYVFSATVNWDEASYSWHLGR